MNDSETIPGQGVPPPNVILSETTPKYSRRFPTRFSFRVRVKPRTGRFSRFSHLSNIVFIPPNVTRPDRSIPPRSFELSSKTQNPDFHRYIVHGRIFRIRSDFGKVGTGNKCRTWPVRPPEELFDRRPRNHRLCIFSTVIIVIITHRSGQKKSPYFFFNKKTFFCCCMFATYR